VDASGDIESMNLLAGQSAGLTTEIKPAAAIVHELISQATAIMTASLGAMSAKNA
jgi:NAD(P)H-dependent flavin oxidoreductase YrpB (nitropropane dioxygenase family)